MHKFEVPIKIIEYGFAIVKANDEHEARAMAQNHQGKITIWPDQDFIAGDEVAIQIRDEEE